LQRDGALNNFEVKGEVFLTVNDKTKANSYVLLDIENPKNFNVKPHPNLDKGLWNEKTALSRKEGFPGHNRISTLKYRYSSNDSNDLPFSFSYWPSDNAVTFELEFNAGQTRIQLLQDVSVTIAYPSFEKPSITDVQNGDFEINDSKSVMNWLVRNLNQQNRNASIDIAFSNKTKPDDIFPISVDFKLDKTFFKIGVKAVNSTDGSAVSYESKSSLSVENLRIE